MKKLLTLTLLIPSLAFAQSSGTTLELSLEQAVSTALENNQNLKNAGLDVDYAHHQVTEIKSMGLPQVNGNVNFTHNLEIATQVFPDFISPAVYGVLAQENVVPYDPNRTFGSAPVKFGVPYSFQATMGLNQLVFDGTFFLGLKAAQEFVNISTLLVSQSEIDIKAGVLKSYYMALISQKNLGQLNKSLENLNKLKSETEALYTEGFAEKLDVDRLILSVSQLEISINNLKNQAELAKKLLLHSMGLDVNQELKLTSELPTLENGDFQESYPMTTDYAKRIEVQLLEQQQTLNQLNLKRYQMGYIPSIYLNANYGYNSFAQDGQFNQLGKDWYSMSSYGFNLNIPVFDGMYKKSKADQVRVDMMKMENTLEMAKNGIALEVAQAVISYENAYKNMQLQKQSMDLSLRIYNTTEVKFKEGIGSSFEMVTAERDLTMAQTNYLNALYELSVAKINLDIAYGNL